LIIAGRREITRHWWENERRKYSLYISALVLQESQRGEPEAAKKRREALKGIPLLGTTDLSEELADALVGKGPIPAKYPEDASTSPWLRQAKWTICSHGTFATSTMQ
jgi:hypothetical protein